MDRHIHAEGALINKKIFRNLAKNSIRQISSNPIKTDAFTKITGKKPCGLLKRSPLQNETNFSFEQFLKKLFITKAILCSSNENAFEYINNIIKTLLIKNSGNYTLGITPTIPIDFPYLNCDEWFKSIIRAIEINLPSSPNHPKPVIVIETKRQHLLNGYYKNNLNFLKILTNRLQDKIEITIGLGDDASKTPLTTKNILNTYEQYILQAKEVNPKIKIQLHQLEQSSCPTNILADEFNKVFSLLKRQNITGVTWIHMGNLPKIPNYLSKLSQLISRRDKIVICYSSNLCLKNDFLLDDRNIFNFILQNKIRSISLGTDDPLVFNTSTIRAERVKIKKHLINDMNYPINDVKKVMKLLLDKS